VACHFPLANVEIGYAYAAEFDTVKQQQILELPGSHETMNPSILYDTYVSRVAALKIGDMEVAPQSLLDRLGQLAFADAKGVSRY
jgi:hypothetical protein